MIAFKIPPLTSLSHCRPLRRSSAVCGGFLSFKLYPFLHYGFLSFSFCICMVVASRTVKGTRYPCIGHGVRQGWEHFSTMEFLPAYISVMGSYSDLSQI